MAQKVMYPGMVNSPETTITNGISESDTIIYVLDPARVPEPPNLMTLGTGTNAETVKVLEINDNAITVERGFQGVAKSWPAGTVIARNFTAYDYDTLKENIEDLDASKETPAGAQAKADAALAAAKQYTDQEVAEVSQALAAHQAESAADDVHGLSFKGAMITLSANQSIPDSVITKVAYDAVRYDDLSFFDAVNNRFVIPNGVSKVRLHAQVFWASSATGYRLAYFMKNGHINFEGNARNISNGVSGTNTILSIKSTVLSVTPGDYFEVMVSQNSGSALDLIAANVTNYFAIEVVE